MRYSVSILLVIVTITGCATYVPPHYTGRYYGSAARDLADEGWKAITDKDYSQAMTIAANCIFTYQDKAKASNQDCGRKDEIPDTADCALLNEVAECWGIKILALKETGETAKIKEACDEVYKHYSNSMPVYDSMSWPWTVPGLCDGILKDE